MLIAVLSDIHGNARALKACLGHARERGAQGYVFLGDYISDGAYPQRTMEQVYDCAARFDCRFIRGNREEYMLDYRAGKISGWQDGSSTGSLLYTYENLTARDLDWFQSLEIAGRESFPGSPPLFYCHGSPWAVGGRLEQGDPVAKEKLGELPEKFILCGHTHRLGSWFSGLFERGCQQVVRAGSVGFPLSTPGKAQMLFLHSVEGDMPRWRPEYALVPYDLEGAVGDLEESGLLERGRVWTAMVRHALITGENMVGLLPPYAQALYERDCGRKAPYQEIPEEYWQQAALAYRCETAC